MQIGMVGLGRMGGNMSRRLLRGGHQVVAYDRTAESVKVLAAEGALAASSLATLASQLAPPRVVWLMLPAEVVDAAIDDLRPYLAAGDTIIDGGNSHFRDAPRRAARLAEHQLAFIDVGTSGGIWGIDRGYCLMIGGPRDIVARLEPIFQTLAPSGTGTAEAGPGLAATPAERGYLHCGPHGAGHFVKMVHNGIEYGLMAAYAEGLNLLAHAPGYELDIAQVAEVWRRGSVVESWLLDLTAAALKADPQLAAFTGHVGDSGEGRWTVSTAVDAAVPVPVLATALFARFSSRDEDHFANRLLSAMRAQFGGHREK